MKTKSLYDIISQIVGKTKEEYNNIMIQNITYDSRKVIEGSLFVAVKGFKVDGHSFLEGAEKNGAVAAVVENRNETITIPQFIVENSRHSMAQVVKEFYSPELSQIRTVGITGTNGKTTTTYLVKAVLESAGLSSGLVGTIEYDIGGEKISSWNTTPESTDLLDMMYSMYSKGQKGCVMEVSSHGLSLNRVDSIDFHYHHYQQSSVSISIAIFPNLYHLHLLLVYVC